jgi:hypothetical protein
MQPREHPAPRCARSSRQQAESSTNSACRRSGGPPRPGPATQGAARGTLCVVCACARPDENKILECRSINPPRACGVIIKARNLVSAGRANNNQEQEHINEMPKPGAHTKTISWTHRGTHGDWREHKELPSFRARGYRLPGPPATPTSRGPGAAGGGVATPAGPTGLVIAGALTPIGAVVPRWPTEPVTERWEYKNQRSGQNKLNPFTRDRGDAQDARVTKRKEAVCVWRAS